MAPCANSANQLYIPIFPSNCKIGWTAMNVENMRNAMNPRIKIKIASKIATTIKSVFMSSPLSSESVAPNDERSYFSPKVPVESGHPMSV